MEERRGARHHTIVVVDVEGFGDQRRTNPHQRAVRDGLYQVVQKAFRAADIAWEGCYHEDRGDAVFILAPAEVEKSVFVETLPPAMVTALRVHNDTHPDAQRIRLRMALHAGEVHYDDHGVTSASLTLAFRLNDATPLKTALAASPGVLAVITSGWFFDDVVRHTPGAAPATYRPVDVVVKETTTTGWITLPDHPYPPNPLAVTTLPVSGTQLTGRDEPRVGIVPRQLPLTVRDFTGRADHLAALDALLPPETEQRDGDAQAVVISAVDGTAGIGKTTLAVHWAHRVQHRFPDGTLHINLRGYGPGDPATPSEALEEFLRALDTPATAMPIGLDAQAALFRTLLAGRRMLIVLDNANHPDQIRPLLPGTAGCMVLVTSRDSLTGLVVTEAAHRLTLDLLTPPEAHHLVASIIGTDRVTAEPDAVTDLIRLCARLPLALRIAAGRVAAQPHTTVADIVADLADDRSRLDALSWGGDDRAAVRAVFDWSYQRLLPHQARLFRRLGLHPGPDLSLPAAAAIAELAPTDTRPLLNALTDAHLIEPAAGGRYRFHDLLRTYAADQARRYDSQHDQTRAIESVLAWYAHTAHVADQQLFPAHQRLTTPVVEKTHPYPITDYERAWMWVNSERANLIAGLHYATGHGMDHYVLPLADVCRFLILLASWEEWIDTVQVGLAVARRSGDRAYEARFLLEHAETLVNLHREDAEVDLERAVALARELGIVSLQVGALNTLGRLFRRRGWFVEALSCLDEAFTLSRGIDAGRWESVIEGTISGVHADLGQYQQALEHGERSVILRRQAGDLRGEAWALAAVATAWQGLGDHEKAIALCQEAITIGRSSSANQNKSLALPLNILAISLHQLGRTTDAVACWHEAATIFKNQGLQMDADDVHQRLHVALSDAGTET